MTLITEGWQPEDAPPEAEIERLAREIFISKRGVIPEDRVQMGRVVPAPPRRPGGGAR